MGCCHGHGPWCHWGYGYPPPDYEGPPEYGRRRRRGRWVPDEEDLEEYLGELEAEIAAVRREMQTAREARSGQT
jgi:hypothetical protein